MSSGQALQFWIRVDLTLAPFDLSGYKTMKFTNRPLDHESTGIYYPLLRSVSGCGMTIGQSGMPTVSSGTISVTDPPDSLGEERCVADLLQRYTPIQNAISLYIAATAIDDLEASAEWVPQWTGFCTGVEKDLVSEERTLTFSVESFKVPNLFIGKKIDKESYPYAPASSIGKVLPLIFGTHDASEYYT